jgi:hypothetical protein
VTIYNNELCSEYKVNPLQSGTPASAITPQGYKNSTQTGSFQGGISGSDLLESNSSSYTLQVNASQPLTVEASDSNQVLGVSQVASTNSNTTTSSNSGLGIFPSLIILVVSAFLAVYFIKKYKNYIEPLESLQEE